MKCVPCVNEANLVAAGLMEEAERMTTNTADVVVYQGMSMCRGHYNLVCNYPPGFPDVPITDDIRDQIAAQHPRFLQARGGGRRG